MMEIFVGRGHVPTLRGIELKNIAVIKGEDLELAHDPDLQVNANFTVEVTVIENVIMTVNEENILVPDPALETDPDEEIIITTKAIDITVLSIAEAEVVIVATVLSIKVIIKLRS